MAETGPGGYLTPSTVDEAVELLAREPHGIVAGGTDFFPALGSRQPLGPVMDISRLGEARGISKEDGWIRIGALTTWSELARAPLAPGFDGLRQAALTIGGIQIQNVGSIGGNLCNASPAADGVPPLLTLEAQVVLRSVGGERSETLEDFIKGNRKTTRAADELMTAILIPAHKANPEARSRFSKLGSRAYMVISIASVAVWLLPVDGRVSQARVAVGACSEVPKRLHELESTLTGQVLDADLGNLVTDAHLAGLHPIDDIRASADYRGKAARTLLSRVLSSIGEVG